MGLKSFAGKMLIIFAVGAFILYQSPIVSGLLGGSVGDQVKWAALNIWWIIPAGIFLNLDLDKVMAAPHIYGILLAVSAVIIWAFVNFGVVKV